MSGFALVAEPPPPSTTPEEDLQSFTAMEEVIEERQPPVVTTGCAKPRLELSLVDYASAKAIPGSTYKVTVNGEERTGTLREDGVAVIEDASVDLNEVDIQVTWFSDREPGYDFLIELVPLSAEEEEEEEEPLLLEEPPEVVWEPFGPPHEPDDE